MTPTRMVLTAAACLALVACSTSHPTAVNRLGTVRARLAAPPDKVAEAVEAVLNDMNIPIVSSASTELDAEVVGHTARDNRVRIEAEYDAPGVSVVTIRYGSFGDEDISVTLLRRIEKELDLEPAPAEAPTDKAGEPETDDSEAPTK